MCHLIYRIHLKRYKEIVVLGSSYSEDEVLRILLSKESLFDLTNEGFRIAYICLDKIFNSWLDADSFVKRGRPDNVCFSQQHISQRAVRTSLETQLDPFLKGDYDRGLERMLTCSFMFSYFMTFFLFSSENVCLMLYYSPELTWRDMQHIVAWSAEYSSLKENQGKFR